MTQLPPINLRSRSSYSLMEAAQTAKKIPALAAQHRQPAVGLIEHNSLAGSLEFADAARKAGVQPVIGCDFDTSTGRITLIGFNATGFSNLLALTSIAAAHEQLWIRDEDVWEHSEGLFLLAGAPLSALDALLSRDKRLANDWVLKAREAFPERFFLEVNRLVDRNPSEDVLNRISEAYDIPMVGTSSAAYADASQHQALDLIHAIDQKKLLDDPNLERPLPGQHFKSNDELLALFADAPHLLDNATRLAIRCSPDSVPKAVKPMLPRYPDADGQENEMLRSMALPGLDARIHDIPEEKRAPYYARLNTELDIICAQGFSGYFLIVADFIRWSKSNNIPVGPGRGSGAGSIVAWAIGITDIDPLRWGLLFERFINPERVSLPDFDVDFCETRRGEVIDYVRRKYGHDRVVAIGTSGTWKARNSFADAARALGISNGAAHAASQLLPNGVDNSFSLSQTDPTKPDYLDPAIVEQFKQDDSLWQALQMADMLQGFIRQRGRHAAGIIIADMNVGTVVPVMTISDTDRVQHLVTQYDMKSVENAGLVKFDFLGLKTTTVIQAAVESINALKPAEAGKLDILEIPFEDESVIDLLNKGFCQGVFQLENDGMVKALKQIKPTCFEDLIALISLYRPGPMDNIPTYAARKAGQEPIQLPHPSLRELLQETQGIPVYQEQIMQMAMILAGYTAGGADMLRRAMGKKIQAEMDAQKDTFIHGCVTPHITITTDDGKTVRVPADKQLPRLDGQGSLTAQQAMEQQIEVRI